GGAGGCVEMEHGLVVASIEQLGGAGLGLVALEIARPLRLEGTVDEVEHRRAEVSDAIGCGLVAPWRLQCGEVLRVRREDRAPAAQPADQIGALHPALEPAPALLSPRAAGRSDRRSSPCARARAVARSARRRGR